MAVSEPPGSERSQRAFGRQEECLLNSLDAITATSPAARELVAKIEKKALQLSALLRELDNHPIPFDDSLREELAAVLDQVGCRIAATRVLEDQAGRRFDP